MIQVVLGMDFLYNHQPAWHGKRSEKSCPRHIEFCPYVKPGLKRAAYLNYTLLPSHNQLFWIVLWYLPSANGKWTLKIFNLVYSGDLVKILSIMSCSVLFLSTQGKFLFLLGTKNSWISPKPLLIVCFSPIYTANHLTYLFFLHWLLTLFKA